MNEEYEGDMLIEELERMLRELPLSDHERNVAKATITLNKMHMNEICPAGPMTEAH